MQFSSTTRIIPDLEFGSFGGTNTANAMGTTTIVGTTNSDETIAGGFASSNSNGITEIHNNGSMASTFISNVFLSSQSVNSLSAGFDGSFQVNEGTQIFITYQDFTLTSFSNEEIALGSSLITATITNGTNINTQLSTVTTSQDLVSTTQFTFSALTGYNVNTIQTGFMSNFATTVNSGVASTNYTITGKTYSSSSTSNINGITDSYISTFTSGFTTTHNTTYNKILTTALTQSQFTSTVTTTYKEDSYLYFNNNTEQGLILNADTDWIWVWSTDLNFTNDYITNLASSRQQVTLWPLFGQQTSVNFATWSLDANTVSSDSGTDTNSTETTSSTQATDRTISFPDQTTQFTIDAITQQTSSSEDSDGNISIITITSSDIITYGDSFSRNTTTVSYEPLTFTSIIITLGVQGGSFKALSFSTSEYITTVPIQTQYTVTDLIDHTNATTTLLNGTYSIYAVQTSYYTLSQYLAYVSSENHSTDSDGNESFNSEEQGASSTQLNPVSVGVFAIPFNIQDIPIVPTPVFGGFIAPFNLTSTDNAIHKIDTNLSFDNTVIRYTGLANVFPNIYTPLPTNYSITGSSNSNLGTVNLNKETTSYSWGTDKQDLTVIKLDTSKDGPYIFSFNQFSSGIFSNNENGGKYYSSPTFNSLGVTIYGGFNPYKTDESIQFAPRAVSQTTIFTDGKFSTQKTINTDNDYSNVSQKLIAEMPYPGYCFYTQQVPGDAQGIINQYTFFPRNPDNQI